MGSENRCFYGYNGVESRCYDNFQILTYPSLYQWKATLGRYYPNCDILTQAGLGIGLVYFAGGEASIGKTQHANSLNSGVLVPYGGKEYSYSEYSYLVNGKWPVC